MNSSLPLAVERLMPNKNMLQRSLRSLDVFFASLKIRRKCRRYVNKKEKANE
jgi:hypothetical protein